MALIDKISSAAINHLVNWQITSASTAGFVTSLGGLATMPITLPANIAGVMAIQMRMIGAIAELGGLHENTEEKKTGMYLRLLGSQAGRALSKFSESLLLSSQLRLSKSYRERCSQRLTRLWVFAL